MKHKKLVVIIVALSVLLVVAICYWFFLYDLSVKWFDFDEVADTGKVMAEIPLNKRNEYAEIYDALTDPIDAHQMILPYCSFIAGTKRSIVPAASKTFSPRPII